MYDKILVPVSMSNWEDDVVKHAIEHADNHDSELHAVHVVVEQIAERMEKDDDRHPGKLSSKNAKTVLSDIEGKIPDRVQFKSKELTGSPSSAIVQYAAKNDIDLIVMGTHGRSGVRRYLLGSVAEEVVRNANCPVLTVELTED
jgi:nucleotide-binding universal stress UspA family protein